MASLGRTWTFADGPKAAPLASCSVKILRKESPGGTKQNTSSPSPERRLQCRSKQQEASPSRTAGVFGKTARVADTSVPPIPVSLSLRVSTASTKGRMLPP
eukprot:scaffold172_cov254-Pinguiococcus_pyrenoidosus.AAC.34